MKTTTTTTSAIPASSVSSRSSPKPHPPTGSRQPQPGGAMLEEAIPALWSAVHGFFTPAVLFVVLNIVIGTIAVTSKVAAPAAGADEGEGAAAGAGAGAGGGEEQQYRRLSRVPSMALDRLRSFKLSHFTAPAPSADGVVDLGYVQPPAPAVEKEEEEPVGVVESEPEPEPVAEAEREAEPEHAAHMERSRSEAAAEAERPRLPARLHKSASDRSAFAHFEAEEVEETVRAVEARRPATTREGARRARRAPVAEPEPEPEEDAEEAGGEVDAAADAFISKFHHQLKLQRIDSFIRHRETVRRGQAAAAAAGGF